jgi:hypothetical protein
VKAFSACGRAATFFAKFIDKGSQNSICNISLISKMSTSQMTKCAQKRQNNTFFLFRKQFFRSNICKVYLCSPSKKCLKTMDDYEIFKHESQKLLKEIV